MRKTLYTLLAALLLLVVPACGSDGDTSTPDPTTTTTADPGTDDADAENSDHPQAILSLSPSVTEMLWAIGAADQVMGVDQYSNHPEGTPMTDLSGYRPNVEAIAGYEPDLVILPRDNDGILDALAGLDIETLLLEAALDLDDIYEQIETLGTVTGHETAAADLVDSMRADIDAIVETVPDRDDEITYYFELSEDLTTSTSDSFIGMIAELAGLTNIADGADPAAGPYPQLTNEYILDADPDFILLNSHLDEEPMSQDVADRPGWADLTAVKDGNVVELDPDISSRWGPRTVDLLRAIVDATRDA